MYYRACSPKCLTIEPLFQKINNTLLILFHRAENCLTFCVRNWQTEITPSHHVFFFFSGADPTGITQGPVDMEIIVGESIVLPCQVTSDPVLDISFSWAFNGQLIAKGDGHFELVGGVSGRTSSERVNGQLAPLPISLHFIPAVR